MAGTVKGSVDHYSTETGIDGNQEFFTTIWRFFNGPLLSGSYVEGVAYNTGSNGTGTEFFDESAPFGENAFFCFRFVTGSNSNRTSNLYVLFQWADDTNYGTAPGNPGLIHGSTTDGVGIAMCFTGDDTNPWNGTTKFNGEDSKGDPVWSGSLNNLYCYPRSNALDGDHVTHRENMGEITDKLATARWHMVADRDNFVLVNDESANNTYRITVIGYVEPLPELSGTLENTMMMMASPNIPFTVSTTFGTLGGATVAQEGGIKGANTDATLAFRTDRYDSQLMLNTLMQPNGQYASATYDEFRQPIIAYDLGRTSYGLVGFLNFIKECFKANNHDITADGRKAVFGSNVTNSVKYVLPWSGSAPGSTSTREGRQF